MRGQCVAIVFVTGLACATPAQASYVATYATFFGGANTETAKAVAVDADGNYYVGGSFDPAPGSYLKHADGFSNTTCRDGCGYLYKFDAQDRLVYSAHIANLHVHDVALGPDGAVFLYGISGAVPLEPRPVTPGAYQTEDPGGQARVVVKLRPDGSGLAWGTYVGGDYLEQDFGLAVDKDGAAYVTGRVTDGPLLQEAGLRTAGSVDAVVVKVAPDGASLAYVAVLGGANPDLSRDIAVDDAGRAHIVGMTNSDDLPRTHGIRSIGNDAFVARLSAAGDRWEYVTTLAGSGHESAAAIALDGNEALVAGYTLSTDFPVTPFGAQPTPLGHEDGFVIRIDANGAITRGSYVGASYIEGVTAIAVDQARRVVLGGATYSYDLPTTGTAFQGGAPFGYRSGFVAVMPPDLANYVYMTYLGGAYTWPVGFEALDAVWSVAIDPAGGIVAIGNASTQDFPLLATAARNTLGGIGDGFVARFARSSFVPDGPPVLPVAIEELPYEIRLNTLGSVGTVTWAIDTGRLPDGLELTADGWLMGSPVPGGEPPMGPGGPYRFTVRATDGAGGKSYQNLSLLTTQPLRFHGMVPGRLPDGTVGTDYLYPIQASGGMAPIAIAALPTSASLPPGLTLGMRAGSIQLYGTPTTSGTFVFAIHIEDAVGQVLEQPVTLVVNPRPIDQTPDENGSRGGGGGAGDSLVILLLGVAGLVMRHIRRRGHDHEESERGLCRAAASDAGAGSLRFAGGEKRTPRDTATSRRFDLKRALVALIGVVSIGAAVAKDRPPLALEPGARIGIINVMSDELTHYHIGTTIFNNGLQTYPVDWALRDHVTQSILRAVIQLGYAGVLVSPTPTLTESRARIYGDDGPGLVLGLTKIARKELIDVAREEDLDGVVVIATERTNFFMSSGTFMTAKQTTLPDQIDDWGVATRANLLGKAKPLVFNASVVLLVDVRGDEATLVRVVRGSQDTMEWHDFEWPSRDQPATAENFAAARPILEGMFNRQVAKVLTGLAPPAQTSSQLP